MLNVVTSHRGLSRRGVIALSLPQALASKSSPIVDTHVHLFADDRTRFPLHPNAPYSPQPQTVEAYARFVKTAGIGRAIIVHPEPYQDDHRYLEYCFAQEPSPLFFKAACLFDPASPATPNRIRELMNRNPQRIVALRIHKVRKPGEPPRTSGAIQERDLQSAAMQATWQGVQDLGLAIQMHLLPHYAPQVGALAARFPQVTVILDHIARGGLGTASEYHEVLQLAKLPNVVMKYSGANYSSKEKFPFADVRPMVRRAFDAFGPDRMIWGDLGYDPRYYRQQTELFETMFPFAGEADRAKIKGLNALRLFRWT